MHPLPRRLREACIGSSEPGREAWLQQLPQVIGELAERWQLRLGAPFEPGGVCAWVAPARRSDGSECVLKVGWRHEEAQHEARGLRRWDGHGVVRVEAEWSSDDTSALLLERCRPGDTLASVMPAETTDDVVAALLRRLWRATPLPGEFRPLSLMCEQWAAEFEQKLAAADDAPDTALAAAGAALFRALPDDDTAQALLCTDLHAENVLSAEREPWLVIDPKPYVGDPTYDALQHLINQERLLVDPVGLTRRMAGLLDLDDERLLRWLFARCIVEWFNMPQLRPIVPQLASYADR